MQTLVEIILPVFGWTQRAAGDRVWLTNEQIKQERLAGVNFKLVEQRPGPEPPLEQPSKEPPVPNEEKAGQVTDRAIKQPARHRLEITDEGDLVFHHVSY